MLARIAVLPQPPLLVPELVAGHDDDVLAVRAACLAAARWLAEVPSWLAVAADAVVGETIDPITIGPDATGTFRGYGVDVVVQLASGTNGKPDPMLPLPALVAGWLRGQAGADQVDLRLVSPLLPATVCHSTGAALASELTGPRPVGLLVLGDGSHRHGARAVGRPDQRAAGYDEGVRDALAGVDTDALLALDVELGTTLGAIGRAPWQVLAGILDTDGRHWRCVDSSMLVPFGVAYHIATWEPA